MNALPRLVALYEKYLDDRDMAGFIAALAEHYSEGALIRLTASRHTAARRGAVLALGFVGSYCANAVLGPLLRDSDVHLALLAQASIKAVWTRVGTPQQRHTLRDVMRAIAEQDYAEAVRLANNLLEDVPHFAEVRNQRAIALFALKQYDDTIADCAIVLSDNPFHFGAAVGMGHAYLQQGEHSVALMAFHHALKINPSLTQIQKQVTMLERQIIGE